MMTWDDVVILANELIGLQTNIMNEGEPENEDYWHVRIAKTKLKLGMAEAQAALQELEKQA